MEKDGAKIVVVDSPNAYLHAMPSDNFLVLQMHELLSYLSQQGVVSLMIPCCSRITSAPFANSGSIPPAFRLARR
ncbi:hypothetical protein [Novosphingopyxis sp.]|uniref:hypothetical protein n=1 Tax=Novosphingopyxis sp. TaxID=2709690 RepID=UPI003B5A6EB8